MAQRIIYEFDDFRVDTGQFLLMKGGQPTAITPTVFRILLALLERPGQIVTKDDLDRMLAACDEIGNVLQLKFSSGVAGGAEPLPDGVTLEMEKEWLRRENLNGQSNVKPPRWALQDVIARGVQDVKLPLR